MYPSGVWRGFWEQPGWGRQPMDDFHLRFHGGVIDGHGVDVIGRFIVRGGYEPESGRVRMAKQYLGGHRVLYEGVPDGEGSLMGTWSIGDFWKGPFLLQPVVRRPTGDEPIVEITK